MANKRMFSKKIVCSDAFMDMPLSTQALYMHLCMNADDEGFIGGPKRILRMIGGSEDDLKLLIFKRFVLQFQSGVIVIKHRKINNTIKNDRMQETTYSEEKKMLKLKSNKGYTEIGSKMDPKCVHRLEEDRLDKIRLEEDSIVYTGEKSQEQTEYSFVNEFVEKQKDFHQVKYQINKKGLDEYLKIQYKEVDKLLKDGFTLEQIQLVLKYVLRDDFWKENCLTVGKLRKKNKEKIPYFVLLFDKAQKEVKKFEEAQDSLQPYEVL